MPVTYRDFRNVNMKMCINSIYGNYKPIGYNESCEVEVLDFTNLPANEQAAGQDVKFPVIRKKRTPIATTTISGGYAVDYRKAALGDMSDENELQDQVRIQIRNKAAKYVVETIYKAIKNATGVKYFFESSSNAANDHRAVTIEVANDGGAPDWHVSDKAMASLINLVTDICKRNNIKELKWQGNKALIGQIDKQNMTVHRWFAAKACPGDYLYNKHSYIANEVNKALGISTNASAPTQNSSSSRNYLMKGDKGEDVKILQENLNYMGYSCGNVDGDFGAKTDAALRKFQGTYKLVVDGKYGTNSKTKLESLVAAKKVNEPKQSVPTSSISVSSGKYIYNGIDYSLVFDPVYYTNKYSDLKRVFGTNATALFNHFVKFGMQEKRQASATFNLEVYNGTMSRKSTS